MFSAHAAGVHEARVGESARAQAAGFAAILQKPFTIDELLTSVATACGRSEPFKPSAEGDRERTAALARRLQQPARDYRRASRRSPSAPRR